MIGWQPVSACVRHPRFDRRPGGGNDQATFNHTTDFSQVGFGRRRAVPDGHQLWARRRMIQRSPPAIIRTSNTCRRQPRQRRMFTSRSRWAWTSNEFTSFSARASWAGVSHASSATSLLPSPVHRMVRLPRFLRRSRPWAGQPLHRSSAVPGSTWPAVGVGRAALSALSGCVAISYAETDRLGMDSSGAQPTQNLSQFASCKAGVSQPE